MKILTERIILGTNIKVLSGDITNESVDAIVNAANKQLSHGGGVALAIAQKGGNKIQEESRKIIRENGEVKTGEAVLTSGGDLKAKYVIHTVGPIWGEGNEEEKLKKTIKSVLEIAMINNIRSLSIPAVSCGIYGFPKKKGTEIIVRTIIDFINENSGKFDEIHLIGINNEIPELFKKALEDV